MPADSGSIVRVELHFRDRMQHLGAPLTPNLPPGSLSSTEPDGTRRMYMFGWLKGERGLWESHGADAEKGAARALASIRLDKLSDLEQPYDLTVYQHGLAYTCRFIHEEQ